MTTCWKMKAFSVFSVCFFLSVCFLSAVCACFVFSFCVVGKCCGEVLQRSVAFSLCVFCAFSSEAADDNFNGCGGCISSVRQETLTVVTCISSNGATEKFGFGRVLSGQRDGSLRFGTRTSQGCYKSNCKLRHLLHHHVF